MQSSRVPWSFLLLACVLLSIPVLRAQTAFLGYNAYGPQSGNYGTLGVSFTVKSGYALTVSSVGYWDVGSNGITGLPISVALFNNATQQVIAGTQYQFTGHDGVILSDTVDGGYRYHALGAPIVLTAGNYTIAEWGYGFGNDLFGNWHNGATASPFGGAVAFNATTIAADFATNGIFPATVNSVSPDFFAGNFLATAKTIPEPTSALLFCLGLAGLCGKRRR